MGEVRPITATDALRGVLLRPWKNFRRTVGPPGRRRIHVFGQAFTVRWREASRSAWAEAEDGSSLPTTTGFWFAWYAFYPDTLVFKADQRDS